MKTSDSQFAFAVHGGAGPVAGRSYDVVEEHLGALASECEALLSAGRSALDVVEIAVTELERSGMYVAGRGSADRPRGHGENTACVIGWRRRKGLCSRQRLR